MTCKVKYFAGLNFVILASVAVSFTACTTGLERRMDKELGDLRSMQAEQTVALSEMQQQVRQITGRLDEIQHVSQGRAQALEKSLEQLGNRLPPPSGVPEDLFAQDEDKIGKINGSSAEEYKRALQALRGGDFKASQDAFNTFASANAGTAFTDNALFWAGISAVKQGYYDQAIVSFSEVYQKYPAEDMVAPALYYMGEALFAMGSGNDGVLTFQKLIDEHPDSEYAAKAKSRIKLPKGSKK